MDVGFGLYGLCVLICAVQAVHCAYIRQYSTHREWALRLFAFAIGSWLFRLENGFLYLFTGDGGHTDGFRGWADYLMDYFFFVPNWIVVELYLAWTRGGGGGGANINDGREAAAAGGLGYSELEMQQEALTGDVAGGGPSASVSPASWTPTTEKGRMLLNCVLLSAIALILVGTFSFVSILDLTK